MEISPTRPLGAGPKTRVCHICGRQYGLHSFDIHLKQCKELFLAREELKDPRDRKKLPPDPFEVGSNISPSAKGNQGSGLSPGGGGDSLDEMNRIASEAFNNVALDTCAYCGRTFLPEKLVIHNKSCTADNPARRVAESVRKGAAPVAVKESSPAQRPSTAGANSRNTSPIRLSAQFQSPKPPSKQGPSSNEADLNMKIENGALVGHLGGPSGRVIRKQAVHKLQNDEDHPLELPPMNSKDEAIAILAAKIDHFESLAEDLTRSVAEMKVVLAKIQELK